jgi:putative transposase
MRSLQKFAAVHSSFYNHFNQERSLTSRDHFKETDLLPLESAFIS